VKVPRTSQLQYAQAPVKDIPWRRLQPGDLVFYAGSDGTAAHPGHVAIYLGGGRIIEDPHTGASVHVTSIHEPGAIVHTASYTHH
jgi:cell wall-associated NlpC family hydrolase